MVNIKDTAPESEEQKFKQKCNELRKRIAEVEESNEISTLALSRTRYSIRRLRLEYSILLERLESRLSNKFTNEEVDLNESEFRKPLLLNEDLDSKYQQSEKHQIIKTKDAHASNTSKKELRDPNMPKRPTNAYLMFCERERENIRADIESKNPGQTISDLSKHLTEIWRSMDEKERMPYWKLFLEDRERYQSEMQIYTNKKRDLGDLSDRTVEESKIEENIGKNGLTASVKIGGPEEQNDMASLKHDDRTRNEVVFDDLSEGVRKEHGEGDLRVDNKRRHLNDDLANGVPKHPGFGTKTLGPMGDDVNSENSGQSVSDDVQGRETISETKFEA